MSNLIFKDWRQRCSSLGHILTNRPIPISEDEKTELANLLEECRTGKNENGRATKWTDTKASRVKSLQKKEKGEDELPSGAITHLDSVFRDEFWGRRRMISNKHLEKGLLTEQDVLDLKSKADDEFYKKNDEELNNDYIKGSYDNYKNNIVRDTKSNYDLKTFDEAELSTLYENQLKGYSWLIKENYKLDFFPKAELVYGLVNLPLHHIQNEMTRQFYAHGNPDDDNEKWVEVKRQIERNGIFDVALFKRDFPHYIFENKILDFDIPPQFRLKTFEVETTQEDVDFIKSRVMLSRIYLCKKEIEVMEKMK